MIPISHTDQAKRVNKPWGYELWLETNPDLPYAMKMIVVNAGQRLSLQAHREKIETMIILEGTGMLSCSNTLLDCDEWEKKRYSETDRFFLFGSIKEKPITKGSLLTIMPGEIHRVTAETDMTIIECSTNHLDDVVRIQDDHARPSGHIASEHS